MGDRKMTRDFIIELLEVSIKCIGELRTTGTSVPLAQAIQYDLRALLAALRAAPPAPAPNYVHEMAALLRSACAIAERKGAGTSWERFIESVYALGLNGVTARTYRVLPHEAPSPLGHQAGAANPIPQAPAPELVALVQRVRVAHRNKHAAAVWDTVAQEIAARRLDDELDALLAWTPAPHVEPPARPETAAPTPAPTRELMTPARVRELLERVREVTPDEECHQRTCNGGDDTPCDCAAINPLDVLDDIIAALSSPVGETPAQEPSENVCTAEKPMPKGAPGHWVHPSAACVYSGDDYDRFECPLCGQRFAVTVPQ